MPVYKDEKTDTYRVQFKEKDIRGQMRCIHRRGFKTRKEAVEFENNWKANRSGSIRITFEQFVNETYLPEMKPRLKPSTWEAKTNMISKHVLPYFGFMKINEIEPQTVIKWQNEMLRQKNPRTRKTYAKSYLQSVNQQLTAILSYAVKFYKLPSNVAHVVGNMGNEDEIEMKFWTLDQYRQFAEAMKDKPMFFCLFQILYWTGIREGEALALRFSDIDLKKKSLTVNKTFHHIRGEDLITTPKTKQSYRTISLPEFLVDEIKEYKTMVYKPNNNDRMFNIYKSTITRELRWGTKQAGLPQIRVHDLRHSHVSLLIEQGYSALAIAKRVGHKAVDITYRYAHLFPSVQEQMAGTLDKLGKKDEENV